MEKPTILVVGSTGHQGTAICNALFASGKFNVRAMVQDPGAPKAKALAAKGATLVQGNLEDRTSLAQAVAGAYGVFAVLRFFQTHQEQETAQGVRLADAAKAAGVQHFVYSSAASAHRKTGVPHVESKWRVEQHIRAIGLPHTIFRPVAFNYSMHEFREPVQQGFLPYAFNPDTLVFQLAEEDYARYVVMAFEEPQHWLGVALDVASDAYPAKELANIFGRVAGRPVEYRQISWQEEQQQAGQEVVNLMRWIERVGPDIHVASRQREYPWLTRFEAYLRAHGWENIGLQAATPAAE